MKLEKLDRLKALKENSQAMRTYFSAFNEATSDPKCDKKGNGFGEDNRFAVLTIKTSFDAWRGFYGNSGCTTFGNGISSDVANNYLHQALNVHKELLFKTAAELMMKEAAKFTEEADKEIKQLTSMLEEVRKP